VDVAPSSGDDATVGDREVGDPPKGRGNGTSPTAGPGGGKGFALDPRDDAALRLWVTLARSYQTFTRVVSSRVLESGLTIPQFGILEALYHLGPLSLGELAEKLLVTGGNVTYVMDRLEEHGLVYRQRSDLDRRVVEARLTDQGRALIERTFPDHARFLGRMVEHLDPTEQEALRELLKRLGKGLAARAPELMERPAPSS
jgi:MarR family transcriptional regulator, 2-MHQ and catechol-resistance regulon repressor